MRQKTLMALLAALAVGVVSLPTAVAQSSTATQGQAATHKIENIRVAEQGGSTFVRVTLNEPLSAPPVSFSVANPARIAFDFPHTENALGQSRQDIDRGDLRSANIVQAGDRTRLVLNLTRIPPYETWVEGRDVIIALSPIAVDPVARAQDTGRATSFAVPSPSYGDEVRSLRDIQFRRGTEGEGRVVVQLASPDTGIDIRQQGGNLVVDFLKTSIPEHLQRRSDVTDFGTPITSMTAQRRGENTRLIVSPTGMWEHNAYQSDTQFVLEVRRVVEDPAQLVQGVAPGEFGGEKLSLNFQNIDVRSVLQVIADFTNFNIVTSDSVQGNLTLRLQDVPWDQALDIILQAKGLDMRKTGNVIWVAPAEELAVRERLLADAAAQMEELEVLSSESIQLNYHSAEDVINLIRAGGDQSLLSARGSATFDRRSNRVFIKDTGARIDAVRRMIGEIDHPPQQVLIEARIVEARDNFAESLGVRLGVGGAAGRIIGYDSDGAPVRQGTFGGGLGSTSLRAGQTTTAGDAGLPGGLNVNLPASAGASAMSMVLWNNAATRFLNLELSALEAKGHGKIISSPRILTANQVEAMIRQGEKINVRISTADSTEVREIDASLRLGVTPSITPDGRVRLKVRITKDTADFTRLVDGIPAIITREAETEVLVDNGGTVVIGGVFEEEQEFNRQQVPLLGDLPVLGNLFRTNTSQNVKRELLLFITPRLASTELTLR